MRHEVFNQLDNLMLSIGQKSILTIVDQVKALRETIIDDNVLTEFVNHVRGIVQREAKWAVIDNGGRGFVAMATGSGKSKVAIELINFYSINQSTNNSLIVPTEKLRDENWHEEFVKWDSIYAYNRTSRLCYASASKIEDQYINGICVLDEAHNITELAYSYFSNNNIENIVALSATPPTDDVKIEIFKKLNVPLVYELSLDNAVKLGFVAPYKITVVYTTLNNKDKTVKGGRKEKPFYQTEQKAYEYLTTLVESRTRPLAAINRMQFIANLKSKTEVAKHIIKNFIPKEDRRLYFCGSIAQAEELCIHNFHSKKKDDTDYQRFKSGEIDELSCVESINEGHNFIGLDSAIITQINSKEKNLIQRIGRLIRFRIGHEAHIYIIVCKGTQDEVWLASCTEKLDQSKIEYINLTT